MRQSNALIVVGVVALIAVALAYLFLRTEPKKPEPVAQVPVIAAPKTQNVVIGKSVEGRDITESTFGTGSTHLLFVGGIHGGYEWNSVALAYKMMDHIAAHPEMIPSNVSVTIVPNANPDGVFKVLGKVGRISESDSPKTTDSAPGRFNANKVDLNRNFDCNWQATSTWQDKKVSAGTAPFSEPESQAIRTVVDSLHPSAVVFWHSKANAVYASECNDGIVPRTLDVMKAYATAAKYKSVQNFDAYKVTGDAEGWLASIRIPAITVELSTHESVEWERNLAGFEALMALFDTAGVTP